MAIQTDAMLDIKPSHLQEILKILNLYVPHIDVMAFGSRVKGNARPYSDLDLAFMTKQPMTLETKALLREAFDESNLPFKVDIVDWASTSKSFQEIIAKDGVLIHRKCKPA